MTISLVSTKLYIPPARSKIVVRPRLLERLNEGLQGKLTVLSASAGYGKTTLVSAWLSVCGHRAGWLSLDAGDNDPASFLTYLCAACRTIGVNIGEGMLAVLQSPQSPPIESILTALLNEITSVSEPSVLVLDDYHLIDSKPVNEAVAFLIEHLPPQMHLVIATREEPVLPLPRLRVRHQLTELHAADLRFNATEAAEFLGQVMGLMLSAEDVMHLESRTEGWIAGLQLAALSLQGRNDATSFIQSFSGRHKFVLDYLVEEVLQQQSAGIQAFLLLTSVLGRMCGPLCDAVMGEESGGSPFSSGQRTLEYLEHANLFLIPLDNERRWYRYHHLFADLLRERLSQGLPVAELHIRASAWYEDNGFELEAFQHAAAAGDIERAARLMEGEGMPLLFRGAVTPVLNWLDSLTVEILDSRPSLWVMYASGLLMQGRISSVEQKLQAAEQALHGTVQNERTRDLTGHIASIRATLAVSRHQAEPIMAESRRALDYLHPDNLPVRAAAAWSLGYAYQLQGDLSLAETAYAEALSISKKIGHVMITIMATLGLGNIQEAENQLPAAAGSYLRVLEWAGEPPLPAACEAHLGLARIFYEWNEWEQALLHSRQSVQLAQQFEDSDRGVAGEVLLAKLKLARGEVSAAAAILAKAELLARKEHYWAQIPQIAAMQVSALLHQENLDAAAILAEQHGLSLCQAKVYMARGDTSAVLAVLEPMLRQAAVKGRPDERLKGMIFYAAVLYRCGDKSAATQALAEAMTMAQPGGFIRAFVDEGLPVERLLREAEVGGELMDYRRKLLAAFEAENPQHSQLRSAQHVPRPSQPLIETLSGRELEILQLIAQGLSNREISERLFLALSTVKGYNRNIFDKLQVSRRTEAVAHARRLGLL
ncbi:LuxR C-terminal-related transcriptional regulator [Paenibacillus sp. P32E]|uniref:LuxR C-terminal-related transcriptional regulator n=1 Tax=Paenibacillus sp. P32E TaxID=1349434 RepID=UPI0009398435|nr:LuxR C-terminal-related transcriptional regulator [Paenibacillus sp. P32E]OKP83868.1 transcriptional regulator [Paenibacillus sp. P32E]